ncbi:MAG: DNA methyltransferase [Planctomycetaceae bacterium]
MAENQLLSGARDLLRKLERRKRRALIVPKYLREESAKANYRGAHQDRAREIIQRWAAMAQDGALKKKETALDANFLFEVFGDALMHRRNTESTDRWELERNYHVAGVGTADGAIGRFHRDDLREVCAVIELKGAGTDLDRDKFNGRTPVQQCWDYLNALPHCPWGIVSNYVVTRLYHRGRGSLAYEEFSLQELATTDAFLDFYCLLGVHGLVRAPNGGPPVALVLLEESANRQREVGEKLYLNYSENRLRLIDHLVHGQRKPLDLSIDIAQKILDRIIFVAFCEDRGLLPSKSIERTYQNISPFHKVTNPRWRNFLDLFHAIDKGHRSLGFGSGYNGGLFRHDPQVDDLQLDDDWTDFFRNIGGYDFRDEINVDVLGQLFERSITELERIRTGGLFGTGTAAAPRAAGPVMPKSAERKRFGVYYTPPEFTAFIVDRTVARTVEERFAQLRDDCGFTDDPAETGEVSARATRYWRGCWDALQSVTVCDPACGSGAFLIEAYEALEDRYLRVCRNLGEQPGHDPDELADAVSDLILSKNLFGVDLSPQAVEITQLALWIRSARQGKTLADLSRNIVCRNSLVTDPEVDERAMEWKDVFPQVFLEAEVGGFDCVIGNPPWERLKLQEREFFALAAPDIAGSVSAATRRKRIAALGAANPELFDRYERAKEKAERVQRHVRISGEFPLTAKGDVNTYSLFAELARKIVAPTGRIGLLVPSGIATDKTTSEFFADVLETESLESLYDFENRRKIFPDVHGAFKFSILVLTGAKRRAKQPDFVFFAHEMEDLDERRRHIALSKKDFRLLNPNTRTCPIFRSRRDADLTRKVYQRIPILVDENREQGGDPWGVRFVRMLDQTNDAELFQEPADLKKRGFRLKENAWVKGKRRFLPLYEAKMVQAYDHRAASVIVAKGNWMRQGQPEPTTLVDHQNPEFTATPRWWVAEEEIQARIPSAEHPAFLAYKDITSATNQRTMIAAMIPIAGVVNSAPLMLADERIGIRLQCCLLANLNALVLDFVARQKVGSLHLNFFIVKQLPILHPDDYARKRAWTGRQTLERWVSDRVLKLSCTADDMRPLAEAAGFKPGVHRWDPDERARMTAELDAAYFLLYGIGREDVEYVLGTFEGTWKRDDAQQGLFQRGNLVLEAYDRLTGGTT